MKKLIVILLVVVMTLTSVNALAKGKKDAEEEKGLIDYMTPMTTLVAEYYKTVAQIKQLENEIKVLENRLERLDAVIKYQQGIEQRIQSDKNKEETK